jgi:glycosyltransferase involved in cell wall biosynthesis
MRRRPLVSVSIPFLDPGGFLREAIDSVLAQTYPVWELLLVDDGSTDGSTEVAREYSHRFPGRICYLEHPRHANLGISASRNLGNDYAMGRYLAYLDADDVWVPGKLEEQVALLEAHPEVDFVYGPARYWRSWSAGQAGEGDRLQILGASPGTVQRPPSLVRTILASEEGCPIGALIRREAVERVGGCESAFRDLYDDQVLYAKLGLRSAGLVSDAVWYWYRANPDSTCARAFGERRYWQARVRYLQWLQRYVAGSGCQDADVDQLLRAQLRIARHGHWRDLARGLARRVVSQWSLRPRVLPTS